MYGLGLAIFVAYISGETDYIHSMRGRLAKEDYKLMKSTVEYPSTTFFVRVSTLCFAVAKSISRLPYTPGEADSVDQQPAGVPSTADSTVDHAYYSQPEDQTQGHERNESGAAGALGLIAA